MFVKLLQSAPLGPLGPTLLRFLQNTRCKVHSPRKQRARELLYTSRCAFGPAYTSAYAAVPPVSTVVTTMENAGTSGRYERIHSATQPDRLVREIDVWLCSGVLGTNTKVGKTACTLVQCRYAVT